MDGYLDFDGSHCIRGSLGAYIKQSSDIWPFVKWTFVATDAFEGRVHRYGFYALGDERKWLRNVILIPYTLFILYLIFIALWEALAIGDAWMAA